jgi:hypothetical protein
MCVNSEIESPQRLSQRRWRRFVDRHCERIAVGVRLSARRESQRGDTAYLIPLESDQFRLPIDGAVKVWVAGRSTRQPSAVSGAHPVTDHRSSASRPVDADTAGLTLTSAPLTTHPR